MVKKKDEKNPQTCKNLWNDLNESYCPNIFLTHSARTVVGCPSIKFRLDLLRDAEFFTEFCRRSHNLGARKEMLSEPCDKQYKPASSPMCVSFLNYKVFPQNGRYHSSIQVTFQF